MFTQNSRSALKIALMAISLIVESSTAAQTDNGDTFSLRAPGTWQILYHSMRPSIIFKVLRKTWLPGDPCFLGGVVGPLGLRFLGCSGVVSPCVGFCPSM